jgi:hypothetical protein
MRTGDALKPASDSVGIQHRLSLGHLSEGFDSWDESVFAVWNTQDAFYVTMHYVQEGGLSFVVKIVRGGQFCRTNPLGAFIERFSSEHAAVGAGQQFVPSSRNLIHRDPKEFTEGDYLVVDSHTAAEFLCD